MKNGAEEQAVPEADHLISLTHPSISIYCEGIPGGHLRLNTLILDG